ncbi:sialidase family protein [Microbispora sp. ZYX-F-249]|uniref:Sialidase family protein n=1 Tax=Microbispora maris TaxID=3144104 RepID=A0ABV0AYY7_9ACTN
MGAALPGPGHGIQLDNGRLLMNVAHRRVIVGNSVAARVFEGRQAGVVPRGGKETKLRE